MSELVRVAYGRIKLSADMRPCPHCHGTGQVFGDRDRPSYTYSTAEPVEVGDVVLVPGNKWHPRPQPATVVALGSDREGPVKPVLRKLESAQIEGARS